MNNKITKWFSLSLADTLGVLGFFISVALALLQIYSFKLTKEANNIAREANDIAKNVQAQEDERRKAELEKFAYLSFRLGRDLTEFTASSLGITNTWSNDRLTFLQGVTEQLNLRLDLRELFRSNQDPGSIFIVHYSIPLELLYERIKDFHNEEIAVAFNLGRYTVWLAHLSSCMGSKDKEAVLAIYERDSPIINQHLGILNRMTRRDIISEYKVPVEVSDIVKVSGGLEKILLSMDTILHQKQGPSISSYAFSCSFKRR